MDPKEMSKENISVAEDESLDGVSSLHIHELEKKILEHCIEEEATIENLKEECQNNCLFIQELETEIISAKQSLMEQRALYNKEFMQRQQIVNYADSAHKACDIVMEKKENLDQRFATIEDRAANFDEMEKKMVEMYKSIANIVCVVNKSREVAMTALSNVTKSKEERALMNKIKQLISTFANDKKNLCNSLAQFKKENEKLKQENLKEAVKDRELIEKLRRAEECKQASVEKLRQLQIQSQEVSMRLNSFNNEEKALNIELTNLRQEVKTNEEKDAVLETELREVVEQRKDAEIRVSDLEEKFNNVTEKSDNEIKKLKQEVKRKNGLINAAKEATLKMEGEYGKVKADMATTVAQISAIGDKIAEVSDQVKTAKIDVEKFDEKFTAEKLKREAKEKELKVLEEECFEEEAKAEKLQNEWNDMLSDLKEVTEKIVAAEKDSTDMEIKRQALLLENEELNQENQSLDKRIKELEETICQFKLDEKYSQIPKDSIKRAKFFERLNTDLLNSKQHSVDRLEKLKRLKFDKEKELARVGYENQTKIENVKSSMVSVEELENARARSENITKDLQMKLDEKAWILSKLEDARQRETEEKLISLGLGGAKELPEETPVAAEVSRIDLDQLFDELKSDSQNSVRHSSEGRPLLTSFSQPVPEIERLSQGTTYSELEYLPRPNIAKCLTGRRYNARQPKRLYKPPAVSSTIHLADEEDPYDN